MIKIIHLFAFVFLVLHSCSGPNTPDCFKAKGQAITQEVEVAAFSSIIINNGITAVIEQASSQSISITAGEHVITDIAVEVKNGVLHITDKITCNYTRDYTPALVHIKTNTLTQIRSNTAYPIRSKGVLSFTSLTIVSEDFNNKNTPITVGDFYLDIATKNFGVVFNNLSNAYITGVTQGLSVHFASGNARFFGKDLKADVVTINHRGTHDIEVFPIKKLQGKLFSTGNVVSYNRPLEQNISALYKGKVYYK